MDKCIIPPLHLTHTHRYAELDLLRTLAIAMMIVYHAAYDLVTFRGWDLSIDTGGWRILARATLTLFLLLVGISFAISWDRSHKRYGKYFSRAMWILAAGMLVSLATVIADPATYVHFGVLHMIAIATLLLPLFARLKEWNVLTGMAAIVLGMVMPEPSFSSVDYVPLLPWFGVILIGLGIGHFVYVRHKEKLPAFFILHSQFFIPAGWPGRHALMIYLIHQPILLIILHF